MDFYFRLQTHYNLSSTYNTFYQMLLILLQPTCFESVALFSRVPYLNSHPGFKARGRYAAGNLHAVNPRNCVNTKTPGSQHVGSNTRFRQRKWFVFDTGL
jgi:hypothetical protein